MYIIVYILCIALLYYWVIIITIIYNKTNLACRCQGDGTEEVIACSWDGQTYLVNLTKEVVRFQFREDVAAFCAGQ